MSYQREIVIVGSCMIDLVCYAPRLPKRGETLKGSDFSIRFGGKGSNQCVAARKLGAEVAFFARVGDDSFGKDYLKFLNDLAIPMDGVRITKGKTSGMAQITVAENGENQIVIVPGANDEMSVSDIGAAEDIIKNCKVLICQMEINQDCTLKALEMKSKGGIGKSILNAAPAQENLDSHFYSLPDIFCVNETEAEIFTGTEVKNLEDGKIAVLELLKKGCQEVIITMGELGALYGIKGSKEVTHFPAERVTPVDTTGAGDAFIGALGFYLAKYSDLSMQEMIKRACAVASLSVERKGTHDSFLRKDELKPELLRCIP